MYNATSVRESFRVSQIPKPHPGLDITWCSGVSIDIESEGGGGRGGGGGGGGGGGLHPGKNIFQCAIFNLLRVLRRGYTPYPTIDKRLTEK